MDIIWTDNYKFGQKIGHQQKFAKNGVDRLEWLCYHIHMEQRLPSHMDLFVCDYYGEKGQEATAVLSIITLSS